MLAAADGLLEAVRAQMDKQAFHEAIRLIWQVSPTPTDMSTAWRRGA